MTQLAGSLVIVLTILLTALGIFATRRQSRWLGQTVIVTAALAVVVQTWLAMSSHAEEQRVRQHVTQAIEFLVDEADAAAQLEMKMRGDLRPDTERKLAQYVDQIELWRTRTSNGLKQRFPATGADRLFLGAVGDVGLINAPAVSRKIYYEYTRLRHCQTALFAILASVDAFVRREQLVESSQAVGGSREKSATTWWPPSSDHWLDIFTGLLALFTAALVWVGWLQWCTLDATLESNRITERAYVGLSHESPGLELSSPGTLPTADVVLRVENHGTTPADVTAVSLRLLINQPLPDEPPYDPPQSIMGFLTARDHSFFPKIFSITAAEHAHILARAPTYVLGYVEYKDRFHRKHRHGYAREYDRRHLQNNLVFVTKPNYNYDREL